MGEGRHPEQHALTTGTSSSRVVYCGVRLSCFMPHARCGAVCSVDTAWTAPLLWRWWITTMATITQIYGRALRQAHPDDSLSHLSLATLKDPRNESIQQRV